ncbi:LacI family DNA-binding transcriptional regulator [Pararhodonellum marinum]|uniref:LacI family DNA-binding transcriptional regulator n=1 Tax=Pararhodonellum marinum TaxID=2755358 RepID=UPI001890102A|nr:LacI family DNA-binding transcriptional regulator [Pararhodonellum marinum]
MPEINIKYLAKQLNLAPSTVSRALNDSYEISEKTKVRVLALAKELNYHPNPYARSLRDHKSYTIAVIIPERINNFFAQVIDGIEKVTRQHGYHLLVYNTHEELDIERKILSFLLNGRVDAIVMSVSSQTSKIDHLLQLYQKKLPVIFFDRICDEFPTTKFITNDYQSGYDGTKHLIQKGCQRLVFLTLSKDLSISKERLRGFKVALKDYGMEFSPNQVIVCMQEEDENIKLIGDLLGSEDRPDGILASVEKLAVAIYKAVRNTSLKIPQDLKLISFSNMKIADILDPPLSTISQPAMEIGIACADLLMKKLTKKDHPEFEDRIIMIPSKITIRRSSGE